MLQINGDNAHDHPRSIHTQTRKLINMVYGNLSSRILVILAITFIGLAFLTSCDGDSKVSPESTPGSSALETSSPQPAFTRTNVPVAQSTVTQPVSTSKPTPTPTEVPWEYEFPEALVFEPFQPAPTPDPAVNYQLVSPDPKQLTDLLIMASDHYVAARANSRYSPEGEEDPQADQISREARTVLPWIENDIKRYEVVDLSENSLAVADYMISSWYQISTDLPSWAKTYLEQWIIRNLKAETIQLVANQIYNLGDSVTLFPLPLEVDGDSDSEWMVEAHISRSDYDDYPYDFYTWLLLDYDTSGVYQTLPSDILETFQDPEYDEDLDYELDASHDFNGDGIKDVTLSLMNHMAGTVSGDIYIYMWNGTRLAFAGEIARPPINPDYGEGNIATYDIQDFDQDGRDELRIIWPRFGEFGCNWQTIRTYHWNGTEFELDAQNEDVPVDSGRPECYINQALWSGDPADKVRWFEIALQSLPADGSPDLKAWVMVRLMAAYLGQNRTSEAERTLQQLTQLSGDGNFLSVVQNTINNTGSSPMLVCEALYTLTAEQSEMYDDFNSEIDQYLNFSTYPLSLYPDANKVCPYENIPFDRLLSLRPDANQPPQSAYAAAGFELKLPAGFNLDTDPELEWVALYESNLTFFDSAAGEWNAFYIRNLYLSVISIKAAPADTDNDGVNELLVILEPEIQDQLVLGGLCDPNELSYMALIVDPSLVWFKRYDDYTLYCLSEPPNLSSSEGLAEVLILLKNRGMPDSIPPAWVLMTGFPHKPLTDQDIYEYKTELTDNILNGINIENSRSELLALIDFIPADDPNGLLLSNELKYLVGLSYELEGQADEAVAAYLQLIVDAPASPFSWLAWTKLEPITD